MPVRIRLNTHSQARLIGRGIDIGRVKETILRPDATGPAHQGRMFARRKLENGRILEVIYYKRADRNTNEYFIITVYYTNHI